MSLVRICCVTQGADLVLCDYLGAWMGWEHRGTLLPWHLPHWIHVLHLCLQPVQVCSQNEILEVKLMDIRGGTFWDLDWFAKNLSFRKARSISNPSMHYRCSSPTGLQHHESSNSSKRSDHLPNYDQCKRKDAFHMLIIFNYLEQREYHASCSIVFLFITWLFIGVSFSRKY